MARRKSRGTDGPGEVSVRAHVGDVERLHGVLDILSVHVVHLADVTVPAETQTKQRTQNNESTKDVEVSKNQENTKYPGL